MISCSLMFEISLGKSTTVHLKTPEKGKRQRNYYNVQLKINLIGINFQSQSGLGLDSN